MDRSHPNYWNVKSKLGNSRVRDGRPEYFPTPWPILKGNQHFETTVRRGALDTRVEVIACGTVYPGSRESFDSPGSDPDVEQVAAAYYREGKGWVKLSLTPREERKIEDALLEGE